MPLKRQITIPIMVFLLLVVIGTGLFFLASYLLPGFLESRIIAILNEEAGITDLALEFQELDLTGANLGSIRIGSAQNPALIVRSIHIDYSPGEIYQKKVKQIVASGVELYCEYKNGRLGLRGFDLKKLLSRLESTAKKPAASPSDPPFPHRIEIRNGILVGIANGREYRIPFEIDMVSAEGTISALLATAHLYPRGQMLKISAQMDLEQNRIVSYLETKEVELLRFADIFHSIGGLDLAGFASLEAKAELQFAPFKASSISGRLKSSSIDIRYKNLRLRNRSANPENGRPLMIDFTGAGRKKWNLTLSGLSAVAPVTAAIADMTAAIEPSEAGYRISGNVNLSFESSNGHSAAAVPLRFARPFDLPLKFSADYAEGRSWRLELTSGGRKPDEMKGAAFEYQNTRITTAFPTVHLSGKGTGSDISMAYGLRVANVRIHADDVNILSPQFVFKGEAAFSSNAPNTLVSIYDLDLPGTVIKLDSSKIRLQGLKVIGKFQHDKSQDQAVTATVQFADTDIEAAGGDLRLKGARGIIPLTFPAGNSKRKGKVSVSATRYQNFNLGTIQADLRQTATGISFNGILKNSLIPELKAKFSGQSDLGLAKDYEIRSQWKIFYPPSAPEIDLGNLLPSAKGFTFRGKFEEQGHFVAGQKGVQATSESSLNNGELHHRKNKISVEGIQMSLWITDLVKMQSAPGQKLKFARATLGELKIENGEIDFQIESPQSILVEKSHFNWCDGKVDAPAIRFRSGIEAYHLILYCDRLNLAKVLQQFGAASVTAEGELNGKIPLRYQNGRLSFKDGFLFTTPGASGKIRMTDTEILTAGIPPDTPQYVQMELARKALEDYDYSWAKLNLTSEGENLLLNMQLDGKPAKSLPFVYRKDMGSFAKVEAGVQGSTFQGIRLDVNFRLPLNKIMQYRELIQMIQKSRE